MATKPATAERAARARQTVTDCGRMAAGGHSGRYLRWFSDPAVMGYLNLRNLPSREQEEEFVRRMAAADTEVFWAILVGEPHIGSTVLRGLDGRNRTAHTGIVSGERDCWGQGYATEALHLRTASTFNELGLETLTTQVYAPNEASRRALQRASYREGGWLRRHVYFEGEFHDVWPGEVLRGEWQAGGDSG